MILKAIARGLAATAALGIVLAAQAQPKDTQLTDTAKDELLSQLDQVMTQWAFVPGVDFSKWPDYLSAKKDDIKKANSSVAFTRAVNQALEKFGASHIVFSTPQEATMMRSEKTVGIGIRPEKVKEGVLIRAVLPNTPAAKAKLEAGDIITKIDGKVAEDWAALKGEKGTKVNLTVKRKATGRVEVISVTREEFSFREPEALKWVNSDVALLRIPSFMFFDREKVEGFVKESQKAKAVIVDLRNNGGGQVLHLLTLCGYFMPDDKPMGTWLTRSLVNNYVKETKGNPTDYQKIAEFSKTKLYPFKSDKVKYKGEVIVLVNGGTGSAAEMFAAGARDVLGAKVIGSKSAGAVLASVIRPLKYGYTIQYPFQDYVTVKGLRLEGNGVVPDMTASTPQELDGPDDPGIKASLTVLKEKGIALKD
ncbi:MAG: PDZ domain-containing protein [Armatimonadetes bacterium]|nr:PDZ domain-containing protein [Armatimonadota bacterium]